MRSEVKAVLAYAGLTLLFTYPLLFNFTSKILGDGDAWLFTWNMWWMRSALLDFRNPFCTDYIHYPTGTCAYLHTWNFPATVISVPLQNFFSTVTLFNLFVFLSFVLSGWGMFRLARLLGLKPGGAFLAGIAFSFSPYHFSHAQGHFNLVSYQWIPFFFASLLAAEQKGWSRRPVLAASAWLILVALTDWYYFVFCLFGTALLALGRGFQGRVTWLRALSGSARVLVIAFAILSPLWGAMIWQAGDIPAEEAARSFSADLQSFVLPGPVSTYGRWFQRWHLEWTGTPSEFGSFVPWSVLLLAMFGWRWAPPGLGRWLTIWVLVFFILSLGPFLHVGGTIYESILLPYGWIEKIPGVGIMRAPVRFHLMTYLGICLLYGIGCNGWIYRSRAAARGVLLASLVLLESLSIPMMMAGKDISHFYEALKESPEQGAVIDLHYASRALYYQTVHQKKILGNYGMLSRQSTVSLDFLRDTPGVRELVMENQVRFAANGSPAEIVQKNKEGLQDGFTFVAVGNVLVSGRLKVESLTPHELWVEDSRLTLKPALETTVELGPVPKKRLVRLRLWVQQGNDSGDLLRIQLNGTELSPQDVEPLARIPGSEQGFTCLFYALSFTPASGDDLVRDLQELGFGWIIVPFYGNDHFVRSLGLEAEFEDRWLAAYRIGE